MTPAEQNDRAHERPACPACRGTRFRLLFPAFGHEYERCRTCGYQRMADPGAPTAIDEHYAEDREHGQDAYQEHANNLKRFGAMIARIEAHLPAPEGGRRRRLLDVGCSIGSSLVAARERGWEAVGTELCRPAVEWAQKEWKLDVREGHLETLDLGLASFDAVLMNHTLEHLREPDRVLARLHALLGPGGIVYQALPNHGGLKARLFERHWSYGVQPGHLSLFTPATLGRLLRDAGFEVVQTLTFSSKADPHLYYAFMARTGQLDRMKRRIGCPGREVEREAYVRYVTNHRLAFWLCNRAWPERLVQHLGLGEDLHMLAKKR